MGSPCSPVAGWLLLVWKRGSPVWMGVGPSLPAVSGQRLIYSGKQPHTHYFQNKHAMLGFNFTPMYIFICMFLFFLIKNFREIKG